MRRLSLTIFLSLLASLLLMAAAVAFFWQWRLDNRTEAQENRFTEALAAEVIPAATEGVERLQQALWHWQHRLRIDLQVIDAQGRVLAAAGRPFRADDAGVRQEEQPGLEEMPPPPGLDAPLPPGEALHARRPQGRHGQAREGEGPRRAMVAVIHRVALPDDRTLLIRTWRPAPPQLPISAPLALALLFVAVGLAAWPVSQRITRRLEALQRSVDAQAAGDLRVRAEVSGQDEVAALAHSFNHAAERIEALVGRQEALLSTQRRLLANASHELRSPLARIRMAIELMLENPADLTHHTDEVRQNIRELDALVEEILLASRLDTLSLDELRREPVDLTRLAAEEAARTGAVWMDETPSGVNGDDGSESGAAHTTVAGDARLLRRLLRNLLENARRYQPEGDEPVLLCLSREPGPVAVGSPEADTDLGRSGDSHAGDSHAGDSHAGVNHSGAGKGALAGGVTDWLRIEVLDRGPGVPEAARERIFEAFYRVDGHSEQAGNVGLGLSLVRQIARRHGGDARHEPREGGGSRFVVRLPVSPRCPPPAGPARSGPCRRPCA